MTTRSAQTALLTCVLASTTLAQSFVPLGRTGTSNSSVALAISEDGSTIVGRSTSFRDAWSWRLPTGLVPLPAAPQGFIYGAATDVSANGTTIVGSMTDGIAP